MVFREFLFSVDKMLEVFGNDRFEFVERNERRMDMVGLVVRLGHPETDGWRVGEFLDHALRGEGKERCLEL